MHVGQVMMSKEVADQVGGLKLLTPTGTSVLVEGELTPTPEGTKQTWSRDYRRGPMTWFRDGSHGPKKSQKLQARK
eukprot:883430-Pelagomonas_calceolata.AAC.7